MPVRQHHQVDFSQINSHQTALRINNPEAPVSKEPYAPLFQQAGKAHALPVAPLP